MLLLSNYFLIGWIIFGLAELILLCLVKPVWFIILSIMFYLSLMMINLY